MKILHITHHEGCKLDFDFVSEKLGYNTEVQYANWNYNVTRELSEKIWNDNKEYYNSFDLIITSDTAPLSRIFLQNNYLGKLIIWVCNRFDYNDGATNEIDQTTKKYKFPDEEYYTLFRNANSNPNVKICSYTKFEHEYALKHRNVYWNPDNILRPCSFVDFEVESSFPININKSETFFITRYHNDNILLDLKEKCDSLGISNYRGVYNGPSDLKGIKGIIHIPYAWSNLALFENWSLQNVYFIPSKDFLLELSKSSNFFWSPPFDKEFIHSAEWYLPEHKDLFVYFDSWNDLKEKTNNTSLINEKKNLIKVFSEKHLENTLYKWKNTIEKW